MAAAIVLAKRGNTVFLVEKRPLLGPTVRGFSRQGAHFDTGLHYAGGLHPKGALTRYLRLLGVTDLPLVEFDPLCFDRIRFLAEGVEIDLPIGQENMVEALSNRFPADAAFIKAYFQRMRDAFFSSTFLNFSDNFQTLMSEALQQESLASVLASGTSNTMLRTVLSIHCLLYGVPPEEAAFVHHARVAGSYLEGIKTLAGGGKTLVQALEKQLKNAGVEILLASGASSLRFSGSSVAEVVLDTERAIPVDGVVFTAHPALLPPMLPAGAAKPAFLKRLSSLEDTFSAYTLFGKSPEPVPDLDGKNLFICPTTDLSSVFASIPAPEQGPFYISGCSAAQGGSTAATQGIIAFAPGSMDDFAAWQDSSSRTRPEAYKAYKASRLSAMETALRGCCPELAAVDFIDGGTPLTNKDYLASPGGGLYGTKHSLRQFSPLPATRIPNLWMAGQSVVAPGVMGAIISAFVACGFIFGMETIHKEIAACS